jgi:hypothetical protein
MIETRDGTWTCSKLKPCRLRSILCACVSCRENDCTGQCTGRQHTNIERNIEHRRNTPHTSLDSPRCISTVSICGDMAPIESMGANMRYRSDHTSRMYRYTMMRSDSATVEPNTGDECEDQGQGQGQDHTDCCGAETEEEAAWWMLSTRTMSQ